AGLCTCVFAGNTQLFSDDRGPLGRRLLQEADAAVPEPGPDPHTEQLTHVHGWLMCLAWGFLIPVGVVIACFRTVRVWHLVVPPAQSPTDSGVPGQPCWAVSGGLP
ncbi:hypothetical protein WJX77_001441, partial [Trebouxia sp. C0004]